MTDHPTPLDQPSKLTREELEYNGSNKQKQDSVTIRTYLKNKSTWSSVDWAVARTLGLVHLRFK